MAVNATLDQYIDLFIEKHAVILIRSSQGNYQFSLNDIWKNIFKFQ